MRIYDAAGRLVRTLTEGTLAGKTGTLRWDGLGEAREPLRTGIYIILFEALDVEGRRSDVFKDVVVLGRRF